MLNATSWKVIALYGLLAALGPGCGGEAPLDDEPILDDGKADYGDPLDFSIKAEGPDRLRVTLTNSSWGTKYVDNCGITLHRFVDGPDTSGVVLPPGTPAGEHPEPLTREEFPDFCIDDSRQPKKLAGKLGAESKRSISFLMPSPRVVWKYQIRIPYDTKAANLEPGRTARYSLDRPFNLPIISYDDETPRVVAESILWPAGGAIGLGAGGVWGLSGTARGKIGLPHFQLVLEQQVRQGSVTTPLRTVYFVDKTFGPETYDALDKGLKTRADLERLPGHEAIFTADDIAGLESGAVKGQTLFQKYLNATYLFTMDEPSPLFTVNLLMSRGGYVNFDLVAKNVPGSSATVSIGARGMQETDPKTGAIVIPQAISNAWQVELR